VAVFIGTSGWQYASWRGAFYPEKLAQRQWLEFYAAQFQVVEVNNTFYQLPKPESVRRWAAATPPDFIFVTKMNRFLTHIRRLREPEPTVERYFDVMRELGPKLGPVLLQLPPNLEFDPEALRGTLSTMPRDVRVAVEFRHASWSTPATRDLLAEHGAAPCVADRKNEVVTPSWRTADWGYVRLHQGTGSPSSCYTPEAMQAWAQRIADEWDEGSDVFVFFNNDAHCCAVRDAATLAGALTDLGRATTRAPSLDEVRVARDSRQSR